MNTDTAHRYWNDQWATADASSKWAQAEREVMDHAATLAEGARVLDLFAGTGVLGLEALSRGAARAVLVERDPGLATALREVVAKLSAPAEVHAADALAWLGGRHEAFDLVFLDPPFADGLWDRALEALVPRLSPGAWIYVESPADIVPAVPPAWALHREGRTREVRYALYRAPGHHAAVTLRPDDPPATTE